MEAFEAIREDLGNSYTVTYYPAPNPNEGFRKIDIQIVERHRQELPRPRAAWVSAPVLLRTRLKGAPAGASAELGHQLADFLLLVFGRSIGESGLAFLLRVLTVALLQSAIA